MARGPKVEDPTILRMALVGYQVEMDKIEDRIRELQSLLKGKRTSISTIAVNGEPTAAKRNLSEAARRRISAAQTKRWAEHRRLKAQAAAGKA